MSFPKSVIMFDQKKEIKSYMNMFESIWRSNIDVYNSSLQFERAITEKIYDMVLIDSDGIGLDEVFFLSQKVKKSSDIPMIILGKNEQNHFLEKIIELEPYGFVFKPFSKQKIEYTVRLAHHHYIKHSKSQKKDLNKQNRIIRIDQKYHFDMKAKSLYRYNKKVKLDLKSEKLIECLCQKANDTVSYESIRYTLWGDENVKGSTLRTFIYRLRKKLPDLPIKAYSKIGYSIQVNT